MSSNLRISFIFGVLFVAVSIFGLSLLVGIPNDIHARTPPEDAVTVPESAQSVFSAYADIVRISSSTNPEPAVVEVPLPDVQASQPVVFDNTEEEFIPSYVYVNESENLTPVSIQASTTRRSFTDLSVLHDGDRTTHQDFALPNTSNGEVAFVVTAEEPITVEQLGVGLSPHVALPDTVAVRSGEDNQIIVAERPLEGTRIRFPRTKAKTFRVTFTYSQPLRVAELDLVQESPDVMAQKFVRFLAQPGHSYLLPYNPDRQVSVPIQGESPNLRDDSGVKRIASSSVVYSENPDYTRADVDGDGVVDLYDNCVRVSNPEQIDKNNNGRGDSCDDFDKDGVINKRDNCPDKPNQNQADVDDDGIGNVCDDREDRITERHEWVPWVGISLAGLVLIILFGYTLHESRDTLSDIDT